jgi:hypothetical protein
MKWMLAEENCTVFVNHDDDQAVPYAEFMERRRQKLAVKKVVGKAKPKKVKLNKPESNKVKRKRKASSENEEISSDSGTHSQVRSFCFSLFAMTD